jgi:type IV pilus assembly protein PilA
LSAIALPAYQDYVAKANVAAGLAEVTPGKTNFEVMVNEGKPAADMNSTTGDTIGLKKGVCSSITVVGGPDGSIACATPVKGTDATITWTRDSADGSWACTISGTTMDAKYLPKGCTQV